MYKLILLLTFLAVCKYSPLEVTLTQGSIKPTPIAMILIFFKNSNYEKIGKKIFQNVISDNLERSGLFIPLDQKAFIQNNESLSKNNLV